jgi:hypothetical protein
VTAAHGAGSVDISVRAHAEHLLFEVADVSGWTGADPVERHLAFGEFWSGMPGTDSHGRVCQKREWHMMSSV